MPIDTTHFKAKLEEEQKALETELSTMARPNPDNPKDWELTPQPDSELEFHDEVSEFLEAGEEREATENEIEARLRNVKQALEKLAAGRYGICEVGGETIEIERLEANPAARTCKKHLAEGDRL